MHRGDPTPPLYQFIKGRMVNMENLYQTINVRTMEGAARLKDRSLLLDNEFIDLLTQVRDDLLELE